MDNLFYKDKGFKVPPLSRNQIIQSTRVARLLNKEAIRPNGYLDVHKILENYGLYHIVSDEECPGRLAYTNSDGWIIMQESVYVGICEGRGRDINTFCHELGHAVLHKGLIGMAREVDEATKVYENSEWQANEWAGNFLVPPELLYQDTLIAMSEEGMARKYGVSLECIRVRLLNLKKLTPGVDFAIPGVFA